MYRPGLGRYIRDGADGRARARRHPPGRDRPPVAHRRAARTRRPTATSTCSGVNEYFGWYDSVRADLPRGPPTTTRSSAPTSTTLHARQPGPAARDHGVRRRGLARRARPTSAAPTSSRPATCSTHLRIHASKRFVAGSIALGAARLPGASRPGRAARRSRTPPRRGTTRASSRRRTRASRSTSSCASAGGTRGRSADGGLRCGAREATLVLP